MVSWYNPDVFVIDDNTVLIESVVTEYVSVGFNTGSL